MLFVEKIIKSLLEIVYPVPPLDLPRLDELYGLEVCLSCKFVSTMSLGFFSVFKKNS